MSRRILALAGTLILLAACASGGDKEVHQALDGSADASVAHDGARCATRHANDAVAADLGIAPGYTIVTDPPDQVDADLDAMAEAGACWVRVDVDWSRIEPAPGRYDWTATDRAVRGALDRGMQVLGLLAYTPEWARPPGTSDKHPPVEAQRFAVFARAAAERYAPLGVGAWEVWNEPNIAEFWEPRPDPLGYAALLTAAADAVGAVDDAAVIVTAGLSPASDTEDGRGIAPATFLRALYDADVADAFDAVGMHPYTYPHDPTEPLDQNHFATVTPQLHELMIARGDAGTPVWATEFGAPTGTAAQAVTAEEQATHLAGAVALWRQWEWTGPLFVYSWRDRGSDITDREDNFGLVATDGTPKAALSVFRRLAASIDG